MFAGIRKFLWALRLALPKIGVGWMFALLTIDFNRVAIFELGIAAIVVTSLLSIHYFLSPFQVITGRLADTHPILGYRRTPYLIMGSLFASLLFIALPTVTLGMGTGAASSYLAAIGLFVLFGVFMAVIADSYHSLLAEVTTKENRSGVIALVWIVMILSTIMAAVVMNIVRPEFSPELMQRLYNLTPFVVVGCTIIGIIGIERRMNPEELEAARVKARSLAPAGNPLASAFTLLKENPSTRAFFAFIAVAIFSIFLQENIIEVFGAEVFGMGIRETTRFQPIWGGGVLIGMAISGIIGPVFKVSRKQMVLIGCSGTALGFVALGIVASFGTKELLTPALMGMGFFTGIFNVGALALMMEMTVEGATGMYMGLWGVAQALGQALSSLGSGALHTTLIGSGLLAPKVVYSGIFFLEAAGLMLAAYILYPVSLTAFAQSASRSFSGGTPTPVPVPASPPLQGAVAARAGLHSGTRIDR
jgi:MFS transporter, BCD family, chlorophyll transporter